MSVRLLAFALLVSCAPSLGDRAIHAANSAADHGEARGEAIVTVCAARVAEARTAEALVAVKATCRAAVDAYDVQAAVYEAFRRVVERGGASDEELAAAGARVVDAGKALDEAARKAGAN